MSNWIATATGSLSRPDRIARQVQRVFLADEDWMSVMEGGVSREMVWAPKPGHLPRTIIALIKWTDTGKIGRIVSGDVWIGIIIEFEEPTGQLEDDDASIGSLLVQAQKILDAVPGLPESEEGERLTIGPPSYETIDGSPQSLVTESGESRVSFYAGIQARYSYKLKYPGREESVRS